MKLRKLANRCFVKIITLICFLSRGRLININSKGKGVSSTLSNFTRSPFILDGVMYESFEGFWQGLKFPEGNPKRTEARKLFWIQAKLISKGIDSNKLYYNNKNKIIKYNSKELYELAKRAERERFLQNPNQLQALLSTGNSKLIHFVQINNSKSLPRKMFCKILTELRVEFRLKHSI
jgi:predicted NAD-dependent protein-ADP-ribosyltransferase YbiA (DUF1768 family)